MDFSDVSKYSGLACFSPDGRLLATSEQNRIVVRDAESLETTHQFTLLDGCSALAFSPDSGLIFGAQYKRRIVQVFSLSDPGWSCKIDEALAGLTHAQWAPDSRHVLTRSDFNLRLSVWSLTRKSVAYIRQPKLMPTLESQAQPGSGCASVVSESGGGGGNVRFSHSGHFMAVLCRVECKDVLGVYSVGSDPAAPAGGWELLKQFALDTEDCVQIEWSPDDAHIVCVDSAVDYRFVVYTPSGQKVQQYSAYEHALGIKAGGGVKWSPSGAFLAVGSYDQQLRLFNAATNQLMCSYAHTAASVNTAARKGAALVLYAEQALQSNGAPEPNSSDKENRPNPLDDASSPFDSADVGAMEGVAAPSAEDVQRSKAVAGGLRGVAAGKQRKPLGPSAAANGRPKTATARGGLGTKKLASSVSSSTSSVLTARRAGEAERAAPVSSGPSRYVVESLPLQLTHLTPAVDRADPKLGVGLVGWSVGDRFLLSRNDNMPHALWVWDTQKLSLCAVLTQLDAVRAACWDPMRPRFALATASAKLYLWSAEGCSVVDVPVAPGAAPFQVRRIEWNAQGNCILLMDKNRFCCCYLRE